MTRKKFLAATITVVLSALMLPSARADEFGDPFGSELATPPINVPAPTDYTAPADYSLPAPANYDTLPSPAGYDVPVDYSQRAVYPASSSLPVVPKQAVMRQSARQVDMGQMAPQSIDPTTYATMPQGPAQQPGYVRLGAPMYPSPRPNIPVWAGSTMITSPALAPHEMLYPHTYRAIYPPFYHRVRGGWVLTPFGIRSHEHWELQGTQVEVKYRTHAPIWVNGFWHPPVTTTRSGRY